MSDKTIQNLLQKIKDFRDEREWKQFHDPKNLAEAISIESGELLELFLWKDKKQVAEYLLNSTNRKEIADEMADIFSFLLLISDATGIDLEKAVESKLKQNHTKYPVEKSKGKSTKYTKL